MNNIIHVNGLSDEEIRYVEKFVGFLRNKPGSHKDNTGKLLKLSGTWEDNRTPEEIINDIYTSRTAGKDLGL